MKSLIVYYSRYGNTARVADVLLDALRTKGEANIAEIEYRESRQNLLQRTFYRFFPMFVKLAPIKSDLREYDLLSVGIPVWGGRPSAPVTKYLLLAKGGVGKKALCFYIYSFKVSAQRCAKYVESLHKRKGFAAVANVFVHWDDVGNEVFLNKEISEAMAKLS